MARTQITYTDSGGSPQTTDANPENFEWAAGAGAADVEDPAKDGLRSPGYNIELPFGKHFNFIWKMTYTALKEVMTKGVAEWSALTDYAVPALVWGSDDVLYVALAASGPSSTAKDPTSTVGFWDTLANSLGIVASPLTTKGDIYAFNTADAKFPVSGTNGSILVEDSTQPFGFKWGSTGVLHVQDQKSNGTAGGTFTSGAWRKRDLNTTLSNTIAGASVGTSQITLPAGTYEYIGSSSLEDVGMVRARLYNASDASVVSTSTNGGAFNSAPANNQIIISGFFTIASAKVFELQNRCNTTVATIGFGVACSFGDSEVYSDFMVRKLA